ncbi:hypothetical protein Taro_028665 [Colocasia esculenta]|uniref:Protein SGT1 homolog n=1 Tax=Colocasia esculenta TaxID=4460 RepID=A0A843VUV0_COLES|nr:hypothetical protein [Colocasia esculenta]
MAADLKLRAKEAFVDDNFELAVELYTQALDMDPNNADLFADRAQANIKLKNFTEAVADASRAIELDPSMSKAYLRKGTACINLEEYQTAKTALEAGMALAPGDSRFTRFIKVCDERIAEETGVIPAKVLNTEPSVPAPSETITEIANLETSPAVAPVKLKYSSTTPSSAPVSSLWIPPWSGPAGARALVELVCPFGQAFCWDLPCIRAAQAPRTRLSLLHRAPDRLHISPALVIDMAPPPAPKTGRDSPDAEVGCSYGGCCPPEGCCSPQHDYYNSPTEVVLTIFAKRIPSENVHIDFGEQILSVSIEVPGEESYQFQPRLFAKIVPSKCRYIVLSTKIEIHLYKADAITWTSLEYTKEKAVPQKIVVSSEPASVSNRPTYPSSKMKVDWDKLEADVKKEEKEEKLEGDAALNKLFRDIYRDADEDMRRAMLKSFVESNGTVLSTNWKEVGGKKVDSTPPDGMQLKKWEY